MTETIPFRKVFLGVSGASGAIYALRCLQMLVEADVEVSLCYSDAARRVLAEECGLVLGEDPSVLFPVDMVCSKVRVDSFLDIGAPPAAGSALGHAAIIVPCSLSTLASVSGGRAGNLIERVCQVALKEAKPLIMVPRETPLSRIHLDCMSRLAWAGATILPASPGFYHNPRSIDDLVNQVCAKILGVLGIPQKHVQPWQGSASER